MTRACSSRFSMCLIAILVSAASGCGSDDGDENLLENPNVWSSRRVTLKTDLDVEICSGTLSRLDRHLDRVEGSLGIVRDTEDPTLLYYTADVELVRSVCFTEGACYAPQQDAVFINLPFWRNGYTAEHELVHELVHHSEIGSLPRFFSEGLAMSYSAMSCPYEMSDKSVHDILSMPPEVSLTREEYKTSALFVSYLLDGFPTKDLLGIFGDIEQRSSVDSIENAFRTHLGVELAVAVEGFENNPYPQTVRAFFCSDPSAGDDDGEWRFSSSMGCDEENVVTLFDEEGIPHRGTWRTINVTKGGRYDFTRNSEDLQVLFSPCFCGNTHDLRPTDPFVGISWLTVPRKLEEGVYSLLLGVERPVVESYTLRIQPHPA